MREHLDRFMLKVDRGPDCWTWTAGTTAGGYGVFWVSRRPIYAHRAAYEMLVGPIPGGLQIDHLCRNRRCVNPEHLEAVAQAENIRRGVGVSAVNSAKTMCPAGHPYSEANTYVTPQSTRQCRACGRERRRAERRVS